MRKKYSVCCSNYMGEEFQKKNTHGKCGGDWSGKAAFNTKFQDVSLSLPELK